MYHYVLTSGQYSHYGIEGIFASETPIDIRAKLREMEAWLNANVAEGDRSASLSDEERDAAFQAVGLTPVDYEETNYDLVYGWGEKPDWQLILEW